MTDFIFLGSKTTVNGDCSHEIKRCLFLGKESYGKPRLCIKKQRHHFADKGSYSQSNGFSNSHKQMWELDHEEGWVLKHLCFWTVVLEKTFGTLPCTERRSNQPIKEIHTEYSLEGLMLKLKLQYFGYQRQRANSLEKTLIWGKIEDRRRKWWQRMR